MSESSISTDDLSPIPATQDSSQSGMPTETIAVGITYMLALTVVQRVVGLLRNVLFCHWMTDEQLGLWALANSFLLVAAPVAVLGLPGCFGRYVERFRRTGRLKSLLVKVGIVSAITSLLALVIIVVSGPSFGWLVFRSSESWLTWSIAFTLICVIVANGLTELMNGLRQVRIASVMRLTTSLVFAGVAFALIWCGANGALSAIVGFGVGSLAAALVAIRFLWSHRLVWTSPLPDSSDDDEASQPIDTNRSIWFTLVPFAAWLWVMDLLVNLIEITDRYMLLHLVPKGADAARGLVGQYHSSLVIPLILLGIATMVSGALLPHLSHYWEAGRRREVSQLVMASLKMLIVSFTAISAVCLLLSPLLYDWILQGRYEVGTHVLPYTFAFCIWLGASYLAMDYLWCAEKGKWTNVGMVTAVLLNVGLNFLFVPMWGLMGAVVATCATNVALLSITLIVCRYLGCRVHRGLPLLIPVPILLLVSPWVALIGIAALFLIRPIRAYLFEPEELQYAAMVMDKIEQRIDAMLGWRLARSAKR